MSGCLVPVVISSEQPVNNPLRRCMWSIVPLVLHDREDEVLQMSKLNDICIQIELQEMVRLSYGCCELTHVRVRALPLTPGTRPVGMD